MPKIIGEQIRKYVKDQIEVRQAAHGSGTDGTPRTLNQITYLNSKTAWVKLASGVRVNPERAKTEKILDGFAWESLARHFILFGGTSERDGTYLKQRGVYGDGDNNVWGFYNGVYNVNASPLEDGATSEFGLIPMPGITSVDVKCINRGSIKKATVNLKCYSPEQFQIIDLLYLRIGYTMFLEWGNSIYLDKGDKLNQMGYTLIESEGGFFSPQWKDSSYLGFLPVIEGYRKAKKGNYDGLLCRVTNFSWTFAQDGSYDIALDLISLGDVIESLRLNTTPSFNVAQFINQTYGLYKEDTDPETSVPPNPADNWISAYLFLQKLLADSTNNPETGYSNEQRFEPAENGVLASQIALAGKIGEDTTLDLGGVFILPNKNAIVIEDGVFASKEFETEEKAEQYLNSLNINPPLKKVNSIAEVNSSTQENVYHIQENVLFFKTFPNLDPLNTGAGPKDVVHFAYNRGETDEDQTMVDSEFYMRLGHLLSFISEYVIPVVNENDNNPLLKIDYEMWSNKMYTLPYQVSLDPRVCIVNAAVEKVNSKEFFPNLINWKYISSDQTEAYGWTMNIYINHAQIFSSVEDAKNDKGEVNLFDFLNSLCTAINKAMGGINNLEPVYDEDTHTISIVDGSYTPQKDPGYQIELYGYNKTASTFVRNFNLKTEITNDFATMASIGSTAGGYTKGVENTMFSKWNKGLTDRWKEKISPPKKARESGGDDEKDPARLYVEEFWRQRYSAWGYTLKNVEDDLTWSISDKASVDDALIERNLSTVSEFYKYCQSKIQEVETTYSSPTNGFVPISLGLTMDGISGIKIYNEINVDTRFLPQNYNDSLRFIIKGVNHKLSNSDWETNIETIVISQSGDKNKKQLPYSRIKQVIDKEIHDAGIALGEASGESGGATPETSPPLSFNTSNKGAEIARKLMRDLNLKDFQAAAIVGNLIAESGLYPDRIQGAGIKRGKLQINGSTGYGYAQWTSSNRQRNLADTAKNYGIDYKTQNLTDDINYAFLVKELKSSSATTQLRKSINIRQATNIVLTKYERPADQGEAALTKRTGFAQQVLTKLTT